MIVRRPAHLFHIRDGSLFAAIDVHGHDLGTEAIFRESAPTDFFAIRRKERTSVVAGRLRQLPNVCPISVHDKDFHHVCRIEFKQLLLPLSSSRHRCRRCDWKQRQFVFRRVNSYLRHRNPWPLSNVYKSWPFDHMRRVHNFRRSPNCIVS